MTHGQSNVEFWSVPVPEMLQRLQTTYEGLSSSESSERLKKYGANLLKPKKSSNTLKILLSQFKSPIILILLFAAGLSFFLGDVTDTVIIITIILISSLLGFWQEKGAADAFEKLLSAVEVKATVVRDGEEKEVPIEQIVPGDVIIFSAGDIVPADCLILESKGLFVNEATLTGETYPVEKSTKTLNSETPLAKRTNSLWMGTSVESGSGKALAVTTGKNTEFGKISEELRTSAPETEFERGIAKFGHFLMEVTMLMVITIFAINVYLQRPILDSFLFSLALAVGLTPQLLPAIISVNLSHGAREMAENKVIVKRLASIENLGSMNLLCSDKTGTLTEGELKLHSIRDVKGSQSEKILLYASLNAYYQKGFKNPIDRAILTQNRFEMGEYKSLDEVPYDFIRKRLSVLVSKNENNLMITKGALSNILEICTLAEVEPGKIVEISEVKEKIEQQYKDFSEKEFRTLGVAYREINRQTKIEKEQEKGMTFIGFLLFFDPLKPEIAKTIENMEQLGISLKIITGDNRLVATSIGKEVGFDASRILTGSEIYQMTSEALIGKVNDIDIFAEVEPNQKERIILALKKRGNVVGYLGDGINDASALHAADVGISVDRAADVAKEAAQIVLMEKSLDSLVEGVKGGRKTFANTLKYVFMATSANFGNMFSMAGASLFLPFLPLLPTQILLTNLLTDFPEMTIATDTVDKELVEEPHRWDINFIRKFMMVFGFTSSVFDYLTFGTLLLLLPGMIEQFRTGWFIESVISASMIVLVIRSRKPFFESRPGKYLLIATVLIVVMTLVFPLTPFAALFGFKPLPLQVILTLGAIIGLYIIAAEAIKRIFYKKVKF
ncbi:Mg(2+) transport ATPase, P-type [Methanosarcina barkeri str. Wiesmoor]|uniref:Magnesium-transporting ATPase, P-type 1 n=2 Tax=Methanosarcina barkeri TaxID=2208 RepID=A0A0E3QP37_METBA|nr:magnesium-translocating P-type ATPase [Methanosarcina barkeri]AKB51893.1 Mg(2+) transport ATPase, P-type [Methanosarcina barkeri str. Wiesmoor]